MNVDKIIKPSLDILLESGYSNSNFSRLLASMRKKPNRESSAYGHINSWEQDIFIALKTAYNFLDAYHLKGALVRSAIHKSRRKQVLEKTLDLPFFNSIVSKSDYFSRSSFSARILNYSLIICKARILKDVIALVEVSSWLDTELEKTTVFEDHYHALLLGAQCEIYVHAYHMLNDKSISKKTQQILQEIEMYLYFNLDVLREFVISESWSVSAREGNDALFNASYLVRRVVTFIEDISILNNHTSKVFASNSKRSQKTLKEESRVKLPDIPFNGSKTQESNSAFNQVIRSTAIT